MKAVAWWVILVEVASTAAMLVSGYVVNWLDPAEGDEWFSASGGIWLLVLFAWIIAQYVMLPATLLSVGYLAFDWIRSWRTRDETPVVSS